MIKTIVTELFEDVSSPKLIPILCMSVVLGILLIIFDVSFASMIFSGKLAPLASRAAGLTLCGCFVICVVGSVFSSFKGIIPLPQDAPTAVLSTVAVSVVAVSDLNTPLESSFMTITAVMFLSAAITGAGYVIVGRFRLANLLRFMPYPVVGGFLAGTGWLLSVGSIGVMCDVSLSPGNLASLTAPDMMMKWVPGILYGTVLFILLLKYSHFFILPGSLLAGMILFYGVLAVSGTTVQEAKTAGFLIAGVPDGGLWPAFSIADIGLVQWQEVFRQVPAMLTVALVSIVGMLLNMSGIELASRTELDMNKEFKVFGVANIAAGFCGSVPGYPSIALSMLGHKTGADSRLTSIVSALIVGGVLFLGGDVLGYFPKTLLGGLVLLLGLFFIYDWIIATRNRLPLPDWLIVISIFLVIGVFGFMEGVAFGLVATVIFFIFRFSRVPVVRQAFSGLERRSMKVRSVPHRHILQAWAGTIRGYELTGYLFFGSASSLVDSLKGALTSGTPPAYLILDFRQVTGFDISAINNFQRVALAARSSGSTIVVTTASARFAEAIRRNFPGDAQETIRFFETLDKGLEWCEDNLIDDSETAMLARTSLRNDLFERSVDDVMKHLERQEYFETLVSRLENWLESNDYAPGDIIVGKGKPADCVYLLTWGTAVETDPDSGLRMRSLEPGCAIAAPAAFSLRYSSPSTIAADSGCKTVALSRDNRQRLETENPALAIQLFGYLIQSEAG